MAANLASHDPAAAGDLAAIGFDAAVRSGNPHAIALVAMGQAQQLARAGQVAEARVLMQTAIDRFAEVGDERLREAARSELAHVIRRSGQLDEAMAMYLTTIPGWVRSGNLGAVGHQLENVAFVQIARGDTDRAARLLGAAAALRETARSPMIEAERREHDEWLTRLRAAADPAAIDAAIAEGRRLSMADAVALATGAA